MATERQYRTGDCWSLPLDRSRYQLISSRVWSTSRPGLDTVVMPQLQVHISTRLSALIKATANTIVTIQLPLFYSVEASVRTTTTPWDLTSSRTWIRFRFCVPKDLSAYAFYISLASLPHSIKTLLSNSHNTNCRRLAHDSYQKLTDRVFSRSGIPPTETWSCSVSLLLRNPPPPACRDPYDRPSRSLTGPSLRQ